MLNVTGNAVNVGPRRTSLDGVEELGDIIAVDDHDIPSQSEDDARSCRTCQLDVGGLDCRHWCACDKRSTNTGKLAAADAGDPTISPWRSPIIQRSV
jgi:hypothetical protein